MKIENVCHCHALIVTEKREIVELSFRLCCCCFSAQYYKIFLGCNLVQCRWKEWESP